MQRPRLGMLLRRGLTRKCPVCGSGGIFESWFKLRRACPTCGYGFERESGYWVSAIIVNTAVTEALFGIVLVIILVITFPDITWTPFLIAGPITNLLFPVFFYPFSKTLLMAFDLYVHPLPAAEFPTLYRRR